MIDVEALRASGKFGEFLAVKLMNLSYEAEKIDDYYYGAVYCNCTKDKCPMMKSGNIFESEEEAIEWARDEVRSIVIRHLRAKKEMYEKSKEDKEFFPLAYMAANDLVLAISDGEYNNKFLTDEEARGIGNMITYLLNKIDNQWVCLTLNELESE